jgi:protein involved in polysaccharide export with SLBB domain
MIFRPVIRTSLLALGCFTIQQAVIAQISIAPVTQSTSSAPSRVTIPASAPGLGLTLPNGVSQQGPADLSPLDLRSPEGAQKVLDRDPLPALGTTQFQSYVAGISGKQIPLFGYSLFGSRQFGAADNLPAPGDYLIGPGDTIELRVWGAVDMAQNLTVDRNGEVSIPKVGSIVVAGAKAKDLESLLEKRIARVFKNFEVSATLGNLRSMTVYVVGQARVPGAHTVAGFSTLISALFETGGPSALGSMRDVQLVRDGKPVTRVDLYDFIRRGDKSGDAPLRPGDVILIPPAGPRVALLGSLDQPAVYELKQDEQSLKGLLNFGGGVNVLTTPYKALIERIDSSNRNSPLAVREIKLDETALKQPLAGGDVVTLLPIRQAFSNAVTLRGNVAAPLRYSFTPGMRISDLIPDPSALITPDFYRRKNNVVQFEKEGEGENDRLTKLSDTAAVDDVRNLLEEINWDYAVVQRFDQNTVTTKLLPFNLGRAIKAKDPAHDLLLQSGDVVTIFGVKDVPVPVAKRQRYVEVRGEVVVPGIYEVAPGDTLDAVVARAGGFTPSAYLYGAIFVRESTRKQQQANLDAVKRRLQSDVSNQSAQIAQNTKNALTGETDAAAIQLQVQEKQRALNRIADLKASGRIALELDPRRPELPDILLEDGDVLTIPVRPSFVAVYGAVYAETSFLHAPNKPAIEYIEQAGPTANAELDGALIVRADGSVFANRAQRSWAGLGNSRFMDTTLQPGDVIFVPEEVDKRTGYTRFIEGAKDWTQLLYQFGIGAAAWKQLN